MNIRSSLQYLVGATLMAFAALAAGCSGSGSAAPAAVASGVSKGAISSTSSGSIMVNNVRFDTSNATITMEDPSDPPILKPGMIVTVNGTFADKTHGKADSIEYSDNLKGPIAAIDNSAKTMTAMGQLVKFDPAKTVFDNFSGSGGSGAAPGQMIQVCGFTDQNGTIQATRIERKLPDWTPSTPVELKGTVTGAPTATTFMINGLTVDFTGLTLPTGVAVGALVKVEGTLTAFTGTTLKATSVKVLQKSPQVSEGHHMEVEGIVSGLSGTTFTVAGVTVNTGTLSLAGVTNGVTVSVEGTFTNGVLMAAEISIEAAAPPPLAVPAAPTGVSAVGGTNQVTISWSAMSNATSYNIYWSTTTGVTTTTGTKITGASSPYVQTGLTAATMYYYIVTAVNSVGESQPSSQVSAVTASAVPTLPAAPTGVSAVGGTNQVTLTWGAVTGATSYNLYWSTTTGVTTATVTQIAGVTSPYVQRLLSAGTPYFYIVTAVNSAGESLPSSQVTATTSAVDGVALYAANCASCHGALATSAKRGRTAAQIQTAINTNTGGMGFLSSLTSAQVQAIADVLNF